MDTLHLFVICFITDHAWSEWHDILSCNIDVHCIIYWQSKHILLHIHKVVTFSAVFKSNLSVQKPHCEFTKLTVLIKTIHRFFSPSKKINYALCCIKSSFQVGQYVNVFHHWRNTLWLTHFKNPKRGYTFSMKVVKKTQQRQLEIKKKKH